MGGKKQWKYRHQVYHLQAWLFQDVASLFFPTKGCNLELALFEPLRGQGDDGEVIRHSLFQPFKTPGPQSLSRF